MALKVAILLGCILGISTFPLEDPEDGGKHWVLIVAGSNGWYNYRHQVRVLLVQEMEGRCCVASCHALASYIHAPPLFICYGTAYLSQGDSRQIAH